MSAEASLRPWRVEGNTIWDAEGGVVVSALNPCDRATRRLIVDAVNERDRLCDLVRRLVDSLQGIMDAADGKGEGVLDEALLREARAAIGAGETPTGKGVER
jgi:hypothetical protein